MSKKLKINTIWAFSCFKTGGARNDPFLLDAELSPLEKGSAEPSYQLLFNLTGKVIHQVLQVIQGFMFELVHM